jgi:hypothetical protein
MMALPSGWHSPELEAAFELLNAEMAETHPEHGEYDILKRARDAVEDADLTLEKLSKLHSGKAA